MAIASIIAFVVIGVPASASTLSAASSWLSLPSGFAARGFLVGAAAFAGAEGLAAFAAAFVAGVYLVDLGAVFFVGMVASLSDRGEQEGASTNTVGAQEVS